MSKKVLLIIIDALSKRHLDPLLEGNQLPNLAQLVEHSDYHGSCLSIFPSITHAALSSIATGTYPKEHGVLGSHWYVPSSDEVAYYSADWELIFNQGITKFLTEFLLKLNHERLQAPTFFEQVENSGLSAASLNFLIFHGIQDHKANMPLWINLLTGFQLEEVTLEGPEILYLGDLVNIDIPDISLSKQGAANWYGIRDEGTLGMLEQFAKTERFPDFTVAYFPVNDKESHSKGPSKAHAELVNLDKDLGKVFEAAGGLDALLEDVAVIVTGDHSQSDVLADREVVGIDLNQCLADFSVSEPGSGWAEGERVMVCPNMRACQVYLRDNNLLEDVLETLRGEERIDQMVWLENGRYVLLNNGGHQLTFARADDWSGEKDGQGKDAYGTIWIWEGRLETIDAQLEDGTILYDTYPNAFERIAGLLDSPHSGQLWLTAKIGHEFVVDYVGMHVNGGSHGSLHAEDSIAPCIAAGMPEDHMLDAARPLRLVDIAPLVYSILGIGDEQGEKIGVYSGR